MRCWGPKMRSAGRKNEQEGKRLKKLKKVEDDEDCKQVDSNWRLLFGCATIFVSLPPNGNLRRGGSRAQSEFICISISKWVCWVALALFTFYELRRWSCEPENMKNVMRSDARVCRQRDGFMSRQCWAADLKSSWKTIKMFVRELETESISSFSGCLENDRQREQWSFAIFTKTEKKFVRNPKIFSEIFCHFK